MCVIVCISYVCACFYVKLYSLSKMFYPTFVSLYLYSPFLLSTNLSSPPFNISIHLPKVWTKFNIQVRMLLRIKLFVSNSWMVYFDMFNTVQCKINTKRWNKNIILCTALFILLTLFQSLWEKRGIEKREKRICIAVPNIIYWISSTKVLIDKPNAASFVWWITLLKQTIFIKIAPEPVTTFWELWISVDNYIPSF